MIETLVQWLQGAKKIDEQLKQLTEWVKHFDKAKFDEALRKHGTE